MNILADENNEAEIVDAFRKTGHSVSDIKTTSPGIDDADVLTKASDLDAILLTNDKDFGDLIYRDKRTSHGVILLRFGKLDLAERIDLLLGVLAERESEIDGAFTVVTTTGVRIRR